MLIFDKSRRSVDLDGEEIRLTRTEGIVMEALYEANGRALSPDDLGEVLYGLGWYEGPNPGCLEKVISRLRKKIGQESPLEGYIITIRGSGWCFRQNEPKSKLMLVSPREAKLLRLFRSLSPEAQAFMLGEPLPVSKLEIKQLSLL